MKVRQLRLAREVSLESSNPESDKLPLDIADWTPNPEQLYRASELKMILRRALQRLSPTSRMVFVLRDIQGLSLEQTAEALGLSVGAVKARSSRARLQLREWLSKYFQKPKAIAFGDPCSSPRRCRKAAIYRAVAFEGQS